MHIRSLIGSASLHAVAITGGVLGLAVLNVAPRRAASISVRPQVPAPPPVVLESQPEVVAIEDVVDAGPVPTEFEEPPFEPPEEKVVEAEAPGAGLPRAIEPHQRIAPEETAPVAVPVEVSLTAPRSLVEAVPLHTQNEPPAYPPLALRRGWEGTVTLQVAVGADGLVTGVEVLVSSGYVILDTAARQAVMSWRFEPAQAGGAAVESVVELPVEFRFEES